MRHSSTFATPADHRLSARPGRRRRATAVFAATVAAATLAGAQAASAATVDMEKLVIAAQLDQYRPNNGTTPGGGDDVKLVQRTLRSKGYDVAVDGSFGAQMTAAYARWQRQLGYSGLDANGLPGKTSLQRLGITTANAVTAPGPRRTYSGVTLNTRTIDMLKAAGRRVGCTLDVTKGSYTGPDSSSAGTHAGGGATDINVNVRCGHSISELVTALRTVGFAAWYRNWTGNQHIHAVAISDLDMATEAAFPGVFDTREQIVDWAQGKDGLSAAAVAPMTIDEPRPGSATSARTDSLLGSRQRTAEPRVEGARGSARPDGLLAEL
jgi:peptidoglycan hydrolase-like protein with peptidoglycan-binding domain